MSEAMKALGFVLDAAKRKKEGKPSPMATCPNCGEPLIATFKFRGKEFICIECRKLWEFLEPTPVESTPDLDARYKELRAKWEDENSESAPTQDLQ